jgi:hypothetical protein
MTDDYSTGDMRKGAHVKPFVHAFILCGTGLLVALVTAATTHYFDNVSRPYWETVFKNTKEELAQFAEGVRLGRTSPGSDGRFDLPKQLYKARISIVEKRDGFLFLTLRPQWPDDPIQVLAFNLEDRPISAGMRTLLSLLSDRLLYHVQYVENGWYYCEYD